MPSKGKSKRRTQRRTSQRNSPRELTRADPDLIPPVYNTRRPIVSLGRSIQERIFPITMADSINIAYNPSTGLSGGANSDITFGLVQSGPVYSVGGGAWNTALTWNNYASLATVFQEYRILKFQIDWYWSQAAGGLSTAGTIANSATPMTFWVTDREDAVQVSTIAGMLQYADARVMQCGTSMNGGRQTISLDRPTIFVAADNDATLLGTLTASKLERSPWLSCGTNSSSGTAASIPHGYIKFLVDSAGNSVNATIGNFTFVLRGYYEYRGID